MIAKKKITTDKKREENERKNQSLREVQKRKQEGKSENKSQLTKREVKYYDKNKKEGNTGK